MPLGEKHAVPLPLWLHLTGSAVYPQIASEFLGVRQNRARIPNAEAIAPSESP